MAALLFAVLAFSASPALAYPPDFVDTRYVDGLNAPVALAFTPDGRLFIAEITGSIRVAQGGAVLPRPAITLSVENYEEQGLLGMSFHPAFADSPYIYLLYTPNRGTSTFNNQRISRFVVSGDTLVPSSETILHEALPTGYGYHVGGCLRVSTNLEIFASTGDDGHPSAYPFSQDLARLEGKLIRITTGGAVPADNPFVGVPGARAEIYHYGLRNPFRFALQPGTNTPFICDTGDHTWEEIDSAPPGANFGWPIAEGAETPPGPGRTNPKFTYGTSPGGCIAGAAFHPGPGFPSSYAGDLFFVDHVRGRISRMELDAGNNVVNVETNWGSTATAGWFSGPVDVTVSPDGALYYSTFDPGEVHRVAWLGATAVDRPAPPVSPSLAANVPNPFVTATRLEFLLPAGGGVRLDVADVLGRRVRTLIDEARVPGRHAASWDRRDDAGAVMPPGVYLARLSTPAGTAVRRMVVLD